MPVIKRKKARAKPALHNFENGSGMFYVQDVYEGTHMENVQRGEVKFLRVVESPEKRSWIAQNWGGQESQSPAMNRHSFEDKRILGIVPVEKDGSVCFEVPWDTFIYFQLLDKDGRMVQPMRSGTVIQSGEIQGCIGCHENRVDAPPASAVGLQALTRPPSQMGQGYGAGRLFIYLTEVQPVFDRHCETCHDFSKPAGETLILAGDKELVFNASYADLHRKRLINVAGGGRAEIYPAKSWGSHASRLSRLKNLCGVDLNTGLKWETHPGAMSRFDRPEKSPCLKAMGKDTPEYREALAIIQKGHENLKKTPVATWSALLRPRPTVNTLSATKN